MAVHHANIFKSMKDIRFEDTISHQCGITMNDSVEARAIAEVMEKKPNVMVTSHGELWVKSVFIRACVKLRGLFRYPRSEPDCMTRPVSEHDQPHIRSPLETAVPTSRLRRAGAQGTKPFYQSACRAMVTIGFVHPDPPELIRSWEI